MSTLGLLSTPSVDLRAPVNVYFISRLLHLPSTPLYGHVFGARTLGYDFAVGGCGCVFWVQHSRKRLVLWFPNSFPDFKPNQTPTI